MFQALVDGLVLEEGKCVGVETSMGICFYGKSTIVTTGTFLRGLMHMGDKQWQGGRLEEPASNELSDSLKNLGLELGRLKTGTPARLDGATVDFDKIEEQPGDEVSVPFSFLTDKIDRPQVPCWVTWTNEKIHKLLRDNLHRRHDLHNRQRLSRPAGP